jgi:demethylmenaquinone methyltransferase/2-methoxy-6-polyprenyl-1,4-benzoquinol methylase
MAYLKGSDRDVFVKNTFSEIAPRYVFMNHLMTGGMDILLRKETIRRARLRAGESVLDIGSGSSSRGEYSPYHSH